MNDLITKENIESKIYVIRGRQVIINRDLANLYGVETKVLMQTVKRNIRRFPESFMFQLTKEEFLYWKSQIVTSKGDSQGLRKLPYAFTEQGVAMIAGLLNSEQAVNTSIQVINAFVAMRHFISDNVLEQRYINNMVLEHEDRLKLVENIFNNFKGENNHIYFKGEIYDAYSLLLDILNKAKKEIIIIDNYIDKNILDILSKINKKIIIITNDYNNSDYEKYKSQYNNIRLIINNDFHDRFIIIDKKELYHSGASFKDLGKKCFQINKIEEDKILKSLLDNIKIY